MIHKVSDFLLEETEWVLRPPTFADKIDSDFDEIAFQTHIHLAESHYCDSDFEYGDYSEFAAAVEFSAVNGPQAHKSVLFEACRRVSPYADLEGRPSLNERAEGSSASQERVRFFEGP